MRATCPAHRTPDLISSCEARKFIGIDVSADVRGRNLSRHPAGILQFCCCHWTTTETGDRVTKPCDDPLDTVCSIPEVERFGVII
jgi:hypothetical protein